MPGHVEEAVKHIEGRLKELEAEVKKLEAARTTLTGQSRGPGRPRGTGNAAAATAAAPRRRARRGPGRPRGRRGGGTRGVQALALVKSRPGITIPEIAKELKIAPNYLYRVMPGLVKDGSVKRDGKGYHAA